MEFHTPPVCTFACMSKMRVRVIVRVCVLLLVTTEGLPSSGLTVHVSDEVSVLRGQDAILGCSFTHPKQDRYTDNITLSWIRGIETNSPFFQCNVKNDSLAKLECLALGEYSLAGNLRQGNASLRISAVQVQQDAVYFCKIELKQGGSQTKEVMLKVQVRPAILSLSMVTSSSSAPNRLQCVAEGLPLPNITWLSAYGQPLATALAARVKTSFAHWYLNSSLPYEGQEELTCRVENALGRAEGTYPPAKTLRDVGLVRDVVAVAVLMLATCGFVVHRQKIRARNRNAQIQQNDQRLENRLLQSSHGPPGGAIALQTVYATVVVPDASEGVPCTKSKHAHIDQQQDILYSTVAFQ
ncbi:sialic acid-binding Ig-like lectin 15 isoform X1 [Hippocampus zosterae]|uniref:sialic acid-binding Ig-like lectin 15 isoform X1 n=1 Tax=Hippocampus zosterae TaxID=109293 RepID=UPI00223D7333|nr:sialic acid-binding Ig-like lectin 15 isoform X1 [Hippocampus zosterae]XP_051922501.1 sialic acid-binding Ig-like lectin 15 isoform X1 [Hippocampus zosterae]